MKRTLTAVSILLAVATAAGAETYTGMHYISGPTDELAANTLITGDGTVVTVLTGGSFYNTPLTNVTSGGTLIINGGATVGDDGTSYTRETVRMGTGSIEINGGTLYGSGGELGYGGSTVATITLYGGRLDISSACRLGYSSGATGTIIQTGGFAAFAHNLELGYSGSGKVIVSGDSTMTIDRMLNIGTATKAGWFEVRGADVTIDLTAKTTASASLNMYGTHSTLAFVLDNSANHISPIDAPHTSLAGGTIHLGLDGFTPTDGQVFDLLKDNDGFIDISQLVLTEGTEYIIDVQSGWTLRTNETGDTLQAVYHAAVPEPATMALLGLGVAGLAARRRRSR